MCTTRVRLGSGGLTSSVLKPEAIVSSLTFILNTLETAPLDFNSGLRTLPPLYNSWLEVVLT